MKLSHLRQMFGRSAPARRNKSRLAFKSPAAAQGKLHLERLEDRSLLATFTAGSIQGQDNWSGGNIAINPSVDQTVDQAGVNANGGVGAWRVSNSTINGNYNGNFNGWPFSP